MSGGSSDIPKSTPEQDLLASVKDNPATKGAQASAGKPAEKKATSRITSPSSPASPPKRKVPEATGPSSDPKKSEKPEKKPGTRPPLRPKADSAGMAPTKVEKPREATPSRQDQQRKHTAQGVGVAARGPTPSGTGDSTPGKKRWRSLAPPQRKAKHEDVPTAVDKEMAALKAAEEELPDRPEIADSEPAPLPPVPTADAEAEGDGTLSLDDAEVVEVEELPEGSSGTKEYGDGKEGPPETPEPYRAIKTGQHFGRFQLLMEMGQGGMATLYLARIQGPEKFEKLVAIKKIHDHLAREPEFINMFLDEARIAAMIHDPHVVTIFDLGQIESAYFIAMEYIHGQNLTDILRAAVRTQGALPWTHAVRIVADSAAGLHAAHELKSAEGTPLGVVHRDVSPQNLLVSYEGHVKVVDFGIAFAAEKLSHTGAGILKGKAAYMSPEQTTGTNVDRRSDIFSLGIVLWEAVCLKRLFREENEAATLLKVRNAEVPKPRSVRPNLPIGLERIVMKALAKDPEDRFATAGELAEQLEELLMRAGEVVSPQKIAKVMGKIFYDKKKIKDKQIKQALQQNLLPAMQGVGMVGSSSTSIEMPRVDSAEIAQPPKRKRSLAMALAAGALFMAGAAILAVFLVNKPGFLSSKEKHAPQRQAATNQEPRKPAGQPTQAPEHQRPSRVMVKVSVQPEDAPVVVTFRGKEYKGSMFRVMIPYSTKAENLEVQAEGYLPQSLVVVPTGDSDIPVTLKKAPPRPRAPRVWKRRARRKTRKLLKDLPD